MKKLLGLVILGALAYGGWHAWKWHKGEGNAAITDFLIGGKVVGQPQVWVSLDFKKIPPGINPTDIKIVFTGKPMEKERQEFDWKYIAEHAEVAVEWKGHVPAQGLSATNAPKLNYPIDVRFPLLFRPKVQTSGILDLLTVNAELFWGGRKQDTRSTGADHWYEAQLSHQ